jgi:hypothetical protein
MLLLGFVEDSPSTADQVAPTITAWGLTWTLASDGTTSAAVEWGAAPADFSRVYWAVTGASPSAGTFQVDWPATRLSCDATVVECPGADLSGAFAQVAIKLGQPADTTRSVTLAATPATTSLVLFFAENRTDNVDMTPEAGWTELYDAGHGAPVRRHVVLYAMPAVTDTTPSYSSATAGTYGAIALEVVEAVAAGPQIARPVSDIQTAGWSPSTGTDHFAVLDDNSNADFIVSS